MRQKPRSYSKQVEVSHEWKQIEWTPRSDPGYQRI